MLLRRGRRAAFYDLSRTPQTYHASLRIAWHSTSRIEPAVRVRYAPSPTGFLHLGGLRTALYNYLFAKATGGTFILRIEDTDRSRQVKGSIEGLISALDWCGVHYDEGPRLNPATKQLEGFYGPYGPYIQSERLPIYHDHAHQLVREGKAYRCFCSAERLTALREAQAKRGQATLYDRKCAHLPAGESESRVAAGEPHVIRMYVPPGSTSLVDSVVGEVTFGHAVVDDQVLLKSDGFPTYHLAAVVDDHLMRISHVIRGQEWLPSTPKHLLLYSAFGWAPPAFAHLPLLLNPDRSKLSKRHGDAAVEDFVAGGYTREGLVNFVALLGWTPPPVGAHTHGASSSTGGSDAATAAAAAGPSEVMSLEDMVRRFALGDVNKSNAVVDRGRLDHFNGEHIKRLLRSGSLGGGNAPGVAASAAPATKAKAPPAPPAPLELEDTPERARVREAVSALLEPVMHALREAPSAPAVGPAAQRLPAPRLNAVLSVQKDRVSTYRDFVPLVWQFVASDALFNAHVSGVVFSGTVPTSDAPARDSDPLVALGVREAAARVYKHCNPVTEGAESAPAPTAGDVARFFSQLAPALRDIGVAWEAMSDAEFLAAPAAPVKAAARAHGLAPGKLMLPLRLAVTGLDVGAALSDSLRLLGREACTARVRGLAAAATGGT